MIRWSLEAMAEGTFPLLGPMSEQFGDAEANRKAIAGEKEGQSCLGRSLQRRASRELKRRASGASAAEDPEAEGAHEPADVVECAAPAQPSPWMAQWL